MHASRSVGVVQDARYSGHRTGRVHPESPERLKALYRMLDRDFHGSLLPIEPEPASLSNLCHVHTPDYIRHVSRVSGKGAAELAAFTPVGPGSFETARLAVGGCLRALEALVAGRCRAAFAFVRPPGHHARPDRADGFCIFNNLGITARIALSTYGLRRVLVVDWDVHHGDGLQDLFYDEREVFYFSTHYLLPFQENGLALDAGRGPGLGYTVNIPVPGNLRDDDILFCYKEVLGPIVQNYSPRMILVAAGFDGHHQDPLGRTRLTARAYGRLTRLITALAADAGDPPILFALEGGYNIQALVESAREVMEALVSGDGAGDLPIGATDLGSRLVRDAGRIHSHYGVWT
jgi:acetoin utilization deacetylase AcuC-like enzyme